MLVLAFLAASTVQVSHGATHDESVLPLPADLDPSRERPEGALTPLVEYDCEVRLGFTVLWHPDVDRLDPTLRDEVIRALDSDIAFALARLTEAEHASLADVRVAIAASTPRLARLPSRGRGIGTHVSGRWLLDNGFDAERAGVVEVYNARDYLRARSDRPDILVGPLRVVARRDD